MERITITLDLNEIGIVAVGIWNLGTAEGWPEDVIALKNRFRDALDEQHPEKAAYYRSKMEQISAARQSADLN